MEDSNQFRAVKWGPRRRPRGGRPRRKQEDTTTDLVDTRTEQKYSLLALHHNLQGNVTDRLANLQLELWPSRWPL